jgi:hypothetical protein
VLPGGVFVAEIDLQTHSRWLRDADPLNIYRYSDGMYNLWRFRGSPNRWRPAEYEAAFAAAGWQDIRVEPLARVSEDVLASCAPRLNARFRDTEAQMALLSIVLTARRPVR